MNINIISIKNSDRRKTAMSRALDMGFEPEFHDAVDLREVKLVNLDNQFNLDKFKNIYGEGLSSGMVGCSISHLRLYKKLATSDLDFHLIVEDDYIIKKKSIEIKNIIKEADELNADILLLGYSKMNRYSKLVYNITNPMLVVKKNKKSGYKLGPRYKNTSSGTVGYVVSKRFVKTISSHISKPWFVADEWQEYADLGYKILHVLPLIIEEDNYNFKSTLEVSRLEKNKYKNINLKVIIIEIIKFPVRIFKGMYFLFKMKNKIGWKTPFI